MSRLVGTFQAQICAPRSPYVKYGSLTVLAFHPELHTTKRLMNIAKLTAGDC